MKLDYIENINEYNDCVVRLYDFNKTEATSLYDIIQQTIIENSDSLDLSTIDFIEVRNCHLTLCISDNDEGISSSETNYFFCNLTITGFLRMLALLKPFCLRETKGYQWLYDIDSSIDFLFSPGGTW
jgi:hypothetical protein